MKVIQAKRKKILLLLMIAAFLMLPVKPAEAATNVIKTAQKQKVPSGKLVSDSKGTRYQLKTGKYAKNKWYYIGKKYYYFASDSYAKTGWFTYKKQTYYADENSEVYVSKWLTSDKKTYYLKNDGVRAAKCWVKKSGKYYYFGANGIMSVNSQISGKKVYYVGSDGARRTNCWVTRDNKRYYFGKDGARYQKKWVKYQGKYYYLQKDGTMAVSKWVGDYHVGADGARETNCTVDGYYLDALGKKTKAAKYSGSYLIVGDSRTVGMSAAVSNSKVKFIGKVSMGYSWLKSTAGPQVRKYLAGNKKLRVVFAFGINDLGNINSYISYYKKLKKEFPSVKFYFLSVNPVNQSVASAHGYSVKNAAIKTFNTKLKKAFGSQYINTYSYLTKNGFSTADGIHYTSATYKKLYKYIMKKAV